MTGAKVPLQRLVWPAVAGFAAGALAQIADGYQYLSELGSRGGVWVVAIFVLGATARSGPAAALAATFFSAMSLVGYYVMGTIDSGWAPPWATVWFWTLASVTVVPALGWLSYWAWNAPTRVAAFLIGVLAGGLVGEAITVIIADSAYRWLAVVFDVVAGALIAAAGVRRKGQPPAVGFGVVVGIVLGIAAIELVEVFYRIAI